VLERSNLQRFTDTYHLTIVFGVVTMREVESGDVKAFIDEFSSVLGAFGVGSG
jgi:hypothetical protein